MIQRNSVFILGAGASREFGLPVASQLKFELADDLSFRFERFNELVSGSRELYTCLAQAIGQDAGHYGHLIAKGLRSGANSIDAFLDQNARDPKFATVGKLAIAYRILAAERASILYVDPRDLDADLNYDLIRETWIAKLFGVLHANLRSPQQIFKNVTFIVFNYDRCIEHYFFRVLRTYFRLSVEDAVDLVSGCRIYHPYGTIGPLSDLKPGGTAFGATLSSQSLIHASQSLQTFTEKVQDQAQLELIHDSISRSERIYSLGFRYNELNLQLIAPTPIPNALFRGTAHGESGANQEIIRLSLQRMTEGPKELSNFTCSQFISNYELHLAA